MVMSIRIALVDDHKLFREGIRALLATDPDLEIVAEASRADQAYSAIEEANPDVVLLDYFLPGIAGPTVAREILRRDEDRRILMLSMYLDEDRVAQALEAGALGYASKDQSARELIEAIRAVAEGERYLAPPLSRALLEDYLRIRRDGQRAATPLGALTAREKEIFELAVRGLSNEAIAQHLSISKRTVETHRGRILRKLHVHSATELVRFAARHGLLEA
jgi:DNA-binding NarL/FixJ family response regulator